MSGEDIDGDYYYKTRFAFSYKEYDTGRIRIDIGDYEFGGKEKVSDALEYIKMVPNDELLDFKKEEDRYLEYLQQVNTNEQTMEKETPEINVDKNNSVTYINVPKAEKDEAKSLGAKWDRNNMCWFVPADVNISLFEKWEKVNEQDLASRKEQMQ